MDPLQLILLTGAAGVLFLIIQFVIRGDLRTKQEIAAKDERIAALEKDKADLLAINAESAAALKETNKLVEGLIGHANQAVEMRATKALLEESLAALKSQLER